MRNALVCLFFVLCAGLSYAAISQNILDGRTVVEHHREDHLMIHEQYSNAEITVQDLREGHTLSQRDLLASLQDLGYTSIGEFFDSSLNADIAEGLNAEQYWR